MDAFVEEVDDAKSHLLKRVIFWPAKWTAFNVPGVNWAWQSIPFRQSSVSAVPDNQHGVYSFSLCPQVSSHPQNSLLIYIGKAEKMTLRKRFESYFDEAKNAKRSSIGYMFRKYKDNLVFCYSVIPNTALIVKAEDALLSAMIPICNERFPAAVSKIIRGIR